MSVLMVHFRSSAIGRFVSISSSLLALVAVVLVPAATLAQLAPDGQHYAGRPSDTGFGGTNVNATGAFGASIPLDFPPVRGGLPIPLQIVYRNSGVGAAGLGWDLPLSYIQQDATFAYRRPTSSAGDQPTPQARMFISLLGQKSELVQDASTWVARYGTLEMVVRQNGDSWLAYDGKGRTYTFVRPSEIGSAGFWLLKSVSGAGGTIIQLTYQITTSVQLNGGTGTTIDLIQIDYNTEQTNVVGRECSKNEITLTYQNVAGSPSPLSMSILDNLVLVRQNTLSLIDVKSRANCVGPLSHLQRLRRYKFTYALDTDTTLPELTSVSMSGREGTPEETVALPVANYTYGSVISNGALHYQTTQTIQLPTGINGDQISGTDYDSSVNAPEQGDRYAMWQTLTDMNGDGRPDVVFKKNNKLWVAYNRPGPNGTTTIGAGAEGVAQLSDQTFSNGPVSTQTSTTRRFQYGSANRNTTDVWREAIDINGDGRMDIIDAAEEPDHWVIYLNTPGPGGNGVVWQRRSFLVTSLRETLAHYGHTIEGHYVPLSRRATGVDVQIWECWRWNGTKWQWYSDGFSNHQCQGVNQQVVAVGPERTFVEWDLIDVNGDGYPDFVFDSSPVDWQLTPPTVQLGPGQVGNIVDGKVWNPFEPSADNQLRVSLNVVGVRFDADQEAFAASFDTGAPGANWGVAAWECEVYNLGRPCDESDQVEIGGLADVNGDGLVDRIWQTNAYLGAYSGMALTFSPVYIALPGHLARQNTDHNEQCNVEHGLISTSDQRQGLRDLTGDGIPDYYDYTPKGPQVWIGTGTGFRDPIPITTTGAVFQFSHVTETCDGKDSNTDGGLFDIDGDGKPDVVGLSGGGTSPLVWFISQLVSGQSAGSAQSGRLIGFDNGYGAQTSINYVSAKQFTDNPVPFPEIVVSSVATTGTQNLGGTLAGTNYAYGDAELIFDSALDRFSFPGYRRFVALRLFGGPEPGSTPSSPLTVGDATITDSWPLTPFDPALATQERWDRMLRVGRAEDVFTLRALVNADPWALLKVIANDPRVIGVTHYEYDAKLYEAARNPAENEMECFEMVEPYDYALSFSYNLGVNTGVDICRSHGFAFAISRNSWFGEAGPPSDQNAQTRTQGIAVDDFGQTLTIEYDNDVFRNDDDICLQNTFAKSNGTFPRVVNALASRRLYDCAKNVTYASESWTYDGLSPGAVSNGWVTSHDVDRRVTDDGTLIKTVHQFDAAYDADGNLIKVRTQRDGATRTTTFAYDSFGLVPTQTTIDATGVPSTNFDLNYDQVSLQPVSSIDTNKLTRGTDYDGFGRPIRGTLTLPGGTLGVVSTASYLGFSGSDPAGRRITDTQFSDPVPPANVAATAGRIGTVFFDELGRKRRIELALGSDYANQILVVGSRTYDGAGRIIFVADPYPNSQDPSIAYGTTNYFSDIGDPMCMIRGQGRQALTTVTNIASETFPTCFQRSFVGHVDTLDTQDAASLWAGSPEAGVVKRSVATAIGRVVERSSLLGGNRLEDATFTYDRLGQLTSITRFLDPVGLTSSVEWSWQHDSIGETLQLTQPETAIRSYSYSDWGEPVETQWSDGIERQLVRTYDAMGRLIAAEERNHGVTDPDTVNTYAYDKGVNVSPLVTPTFVLGHLARATSPGGKMTFSYDALGRVNAQVFTDSQGGLFVQKAENHADGSLVSIEFQLPDDNYGKEVATYSYDSASMLRGIDYSDASGSLQLYHADDIDVLGRVRKALYPGNALYHASYANTGRQLLQDEGIESPLGSRQIIFGQFDPLGRELSRQEITNGAASGLKTANSYDALGRLRSVEQTDGAVTFNWNFAYDALGNVTMLGQNPNKTADVFLSEQTNDRDRICRIYYGPPVRLPLTPCNVTYDGEGNIVTEPTRTGSRQFTYFLSGATRAIAQQGAQASYTYDPFGQVQTLDIQGTGTQERHDRHYGGLIDQRAIVAGGSTLSMIMRSIPGPGGIFASRRGSGNDWVFEFGELRGNRFFTNQDGAFIQQVEYQPFGEATSTGASLGTADYTNYQWNDGDALASFGLSQLGARIYDPVIGRFLTRDPLVSARSAGASNPYAFAANDPVNGADPTGLDGDLSGGGYCTAPEECFQQPITPFSWGGGGGASPPPGPSSPAPSPPPLNIMPQTPRAWELWWNAMFQVGYIPAGYDVNTLAATGAPMSVMVDAIRNAPSPERDAAIVTHNAPYDSALSFSAGFGDAFLFGCPGCGAAARVLLGIPVEDPIAYGMGSITGIAGTFGLGELGALGGTAVEGGALGGETVETPVSVEAGGVARPNVDQVLMRLRDEATDLTARSGRYSPTKFGSVNDAIFKTLVNKAVDDGILPATIRTSPASMNVPGSAGIDVWDLATGRGWDLTTARSAQVLGHDLRYLGQAAPDGTIITDVTPLVYTRP
jgi:RHS repeat-associated protein